MLLAIHGHLRHEMQQVVDAVQRSISDSRQTADARGLINDLTMRVNYRALGSFCGGYCQIVSMHHRFEDQVLFVELGDADSDLQPVLNRLSVEHGAIHDALVTLDAALVAMLTHEADALPRVATAAARLQEGLLDHLDYEEEELLPALGRLQILI